MLKVGIIGAGVMGLVVAPRIVQAGHPVYVYDTRPAALDQARKLGASVCAGIPELAKNADVVLMFLPGPKEIEACVAGPDGILSSAPAGRVICDLATSAPETTKRLAAIAKEAGVGYLDTPVLGRPDTVGKWALPAGGEAADLDKVRPVLSLFAANIFHVGPSGTGHQIKLLNQLMFGAINAMTAEMMAVAARVGVEPKKLYDIITASQAGTVSNLFRELGSRVAEERYENPTFSVDLLIKDVRLAVEMAKSHGAPPLLARTVEFLNETASAQGFGPVDTSVMWKVYDRIWSRPGSGE